MNDLSALRLLPKLPPATWHAGGVAILIAATWIVYQPSLGHVPRWDHWWFLHDASKYDDFGSMVRDLYSYNRAQVHGRGDFELFRPVLFTLLCAEQACFGHNFAAWQAFAILLHLAVVFLLLGLLLRLRRWLTAESTFVFCPLAYTFCLFFSVNVALCEAVMWTHINGYMLFLAFCLGAIHAFWPEFTQQQAARLVWLRMLLAWSLLGLATFTHEMGQLFSVAFAAVLALACWRQNRRRHAIILLGLFALLLPLYQVINHLDFLTHEGDMPTMSPGQILLKAWRQLDESLFNVWRYVLFTEIQPFFVSCIHWSIDGRLRINEPVQDPSLYRLAHVMLAVSLCVLGLLLFAGLRSLIRIWQSARGRTLACLLALPLALVVFQMALNVLGRLNLYPGFGLLISSSYYAYLPLACLLLVLYALWQAGGPRSRIAQVTLIGGLLILTRSSASQVHDIALAFRREARDVRIPARTIRQLVEQHRHDPAFRFSFDPAEFAHFGRGCTTPFPQIMFPHLVDRQNPTHILVRRGRDVVALSTEEHRRLTIKLAADRTTGAE